jgi:tetratricopeptide (TPR) repeat protein
MVDIGVGHRRKLLANGLLPLLLIGIGLAAYFNSFAGSFLFDDKLRIIDNPQIRRLWPLWAIMAESTRPILELSLALNYAVGGLNPWSYHAFNLAVHLSAGLLLFGIVRRMLESDRLRARYGGVSRGLAIAVAGIWLVHPLQTESVTYIIQRAESLMGLLFLMTMYCGIRACGSSHPWRWIIAAVIACALGMGTKEVMVSAPILMLLYDRTFVAQSFSEALHKRRGLYAGLAATWLVLAASLANAPANEQQVYLVAGINPWSYALTQSEVIVHYLRLSLWPHPLVFDYAWPIAQHWSPVAPAAAVVLALSGGTVVALYRRMWLGFWGAWFFLILAPTSSIMPIADVAFEHRMYLSLAAVVVVVVIGGYELVERIGRALRMSGDARRWLEAGVVVAVVVVLGYTTVRRNEDYRSELVMWSDTVAKRPDNARAHVNLGIAIKGQGKLSEAIAQYNEALRVNPDYAEAHNNLGNALAIQGNLGKAIDHYNEALRIKPNYAEAQLNYGTALINQGKLADAIVHYNEALRLDPNHAGAHNNLGMALARQGRLDEASAHFASAVRLDPGFTWARNNLRRVEAARNQAKAPQ